MTTAQDPTVQRRRLCIELRRARAAAKLKQQEVAHTMDWSPSKLIRIERGQVNISTNDLRALLTYYGIKDKGRVNGLLDLAKSSREVSYYDRFTDVLKTGFREYLAYESSASVIRQSDPIVIPGLLQTEEYGRVILHTAGHGPEEVNKNWDVRQHRQEVHDREDPPDMHFVLDEAAVRRHVGGHVMRRQLERLREFAEQPHIHIQIVPFTHGAHPGMLGNFILLEFAEPGLDDLVHLESVDQITVRDDPDVIARYLDRFFKLEELALTTDESKIILDTLIEEMLSSTDSTTSTEKMTA